MRIHKVPTMRMKIFQKWHGQMKFYKYTRIIEHWPIIRIYSKWYIQTKGHRRVFLMVGWNVIGCQEWNNIRVIEKRLNVNCEIGIYVTGDDEPPMVYDRYRTCLYNGCRMETDTFILHHDSMISLRTSRRDIIFHFFNMDFDIDF